ncbi:STT3 domain-containing protein [Candidatus Auribacterota bacterium]
MLTNFRIQKTYQFIAITIFLLAIVSLGFWIRMIPAQIHPQTGYSFDRAFHLRMAIEVLNRGYVPAVDNLSIYPIGKEITSQLPSLMYHLTVYFHKFLNLFSKIKINLSCDYFASLTGALIAIPVYFIAFSLYNNRVIALIAALISIIIPGHFRRTFCYWYKYESIGTLFFIFSLQFFVQSLKAKTRLENILYSLLAAFSLLLLFSTWRLAILVFFLYFLVGAILLILNRMDKNAEIAFSFIFIATVLSSLIITYLARNKFYSSKLFLFSIVVIISSYLIEYIYNEFLIAKKFKPYINIFILGIMTVIVFYFSRPTSYHNFNSLFFIRLASLFGKTIPAEGINKVLLFTQELRAIRLNELFSAEIYSYIIFFIFFYPYAIYLKRKRFPSSDVASFQTAFVFLIFFSTLLLSSILFFRNKVLASPLLAIVAASTMIYPLKIIYEKKDNLRLLLSIGLFIFSLALMLNTLNEILSIGFTTLSKRGNLNLFSLLFSAIAVLSAKDALIINLYLLSAVILWGFSIFLFIRNYKERDTDLIPSIIVLSLSLFFIFKTGHDVTQMATKTVNKFAPEPKVIGWIRKNIDKGTVLMSYWGQGYTTQLYTGCPTLTDGFLENEEIRKRIMEIETAFYATKEKDLYDICKKYHARYIILPIFKTQAMAKTAGVDYRLYENWRERKPTELGLKTTLFKMIYDSGPGRLRYFKTRFKTKMYRVLEVK